MDITKLTLPPEFYLTDAKLTEMCAWGLENYALPEEILAQFDIPSRWYNYWRNLSLRGDEKSRHIVDMLSNVELKWLAKGRTKVMKSSDTRSISGTVNFHRERLDLLTPLDRPLPVDDDWIE